MIEDWLLKEEKLEIEVDKDSFINKTIIDILKILLRFRKEKQTKGFIYNINPLLKFIFTILNLGLISLSRSFIFLGGITLACLFLLFFILKEDRKKILSLSFFACILSVIILLPSMFMGNKYNSLFIIYKSFLNIFTVNILSYTSKYYDVSQSMKIFLVPDIFIWITEITFKYINLLGDYSLNFFQALKLRSIGRNKTKLKNVSDIMGNLFLHSMKLSQEMLDAMECRGFTGEYKRSIKFSFIKEDFYYILLNLGIIVLFIKEVF